MNWLILSSFLPFFSCAFSLTSKYLLSFTSPVSYTAYVLGSSAVLSILYNYVTGTKMYATVLSAISGICFGLATFGFERAIHNGNNPGLISGLYRSQAALTAILSVFFLGSSLTLMKGFGIVITMIGALMIALDKHTREMFDVGFHKHNDQDNEVSKKGKEQDEPEDKSWGLMLAIAGIFMTIKDITAVKCINNGMKPSNYIVSQLLFGSLVIFAYKIYKRGTLKIELKNGGDLKKALIGISAISLDNVIWCSVLVYAMSIAPNPAYPKVITLLSIAMTSYISQFLFKNATLDRTQWMGILVLLGGLFTIVFN